MFGSGLIFLKMKMSSVYGLVPILTNCGVCYVISTVDTFGTGAFTVVKVVCIVLKNHVHLKKSTEIF